MNHCSIKTFFQNRSPENTVPHCTMELSTNASLMSPDIIEKLAESPLNDILISVFGHDRESQKGLWGKMFPMKRSFIMYCN